jgi:hypothetical protein
MFKTKDFTSKLICSVDDGSGEGGGGGGDPALSDAQRQEMIRIQNAANSAHHTRIQKVMDQKLNEMKESITSSFTDALSAHAEKFNSAGNTGGAPGKNKASGSEDSVVATLRQEHEARMAEMEKKFEAEKSARVQEAQRAQVAEERSKLGAALRAAGVPDERLRGAVALLYTEDKRVARNSAGGVVFKMPRDGYTDELELDAGIDEWLKSGEGKHFAPARDVRGSGATGGKPGQTNGKMSRQDMKRELVRSVLMAERNT